MGNKARRAANKARKAARKAARKDCLPNLITPNGVVTLDYGLEQSRKNPSRNSWEGATHLEVRLHERLKVSKGDARKVSQAILEVVKGQSLSFKPQGGTARAFVASSKGSAMVWAYKGRLILRTWYPETVGEINPALEELVSTF